MSWWDSSGLSSFASNVVKSAQKKIDKVLDIDEDGSTRSATAPVEATSKPSSRRKKNDEGDFWNSWLGATGEKKAERSEETSKLSPSKGSPQRKKAADSWQSWGLSPAQPDETAKDAAGLSLGTDSPGLYDQEFSHEEPAKPVTPPPHTHASKSLSLMSKPKIKTGLQQDRQKSDPPFSSPPAAYDTLELDKTSTYDCEESGVADVALSHSSVSSLQSESTFTISTQAVIGSFTETETGIDAPTDTALQNLHADQTDLSSENISRQKDEPSDETSGENVHLQDIEVTDDKPSDLFQGESVEDSKLETAVVDPTEACDNKILDQELVQVNISDSGAVWDETNLDLVEQLLTDRGNVTQQMIASEGQVDLRDSDNDVPDECDSDRLRPDFDLSVTKMEVSDATVDDVHENTGDPIAAQTTEIENILEYIASEARDVTMKEGSAGEESEGGKEIQINVTDSDSSETGLSVGDILTGEKMDSNSTSSALEVLDSSMLKSINSSIEIVTEKEIQAEREDKLTEISASDLLTCEQEPEDMHVKETSSDWRLPVTIKTLNEPEPSLPKLEHSDSSDASHLDSSIDDTCVSIETVVQAASGGENSDQSLNVEDYNSELEEEDRSDIHVPEVDLREGSKSSADCSIMTGSSSSSVVKNMLEDAMEENLKQEETDNHSHSSSDKSDFVKSEFSDRSISGHESGDEIDTTTSSDIEIISTPTPNGDKQEKLFDLSPLKIALSRANRQDGRSHRRSDSQSSSSTNSKPEQMSPGHDLEFGEEAAGREREHAMLLDLADDLRHSSSYDEHRHKLADLPVLSEEGRIIPYQADVSGLLKDSSCLMPPVDTKDDNGTPVSPRLLTTMPTISETDLTHEKMSEMTEVINARENKLVQLSKENNDLLEANSILRNQLKQAEETFQAEMADLNALTEEFTVRIGDSEKKLQSTLREKESLKKQVELTKQELVKKGDIAPYQKLLDEKDQQIKELLEEGEKLSKQQLQGSTIIKKLRTKEKENEQLQQSQKKKLEEQKKELDHLKVVLDSKEDMEKKQTDAIKQLNSAVQKQETEMARLKGEVDESQEKMRSMQAALDGSYKEIAELHRANAAKDSKAQEVALSAEMQAREELRMTMEREGLRYRQERESLIMQIEDLRMSLSRMEKDHGRREDMLRQEISDLHQRLQEDEARNQELTHSVTSATRPLLRQIENLQSTYGAQSTSWEKVEKSLTERLGEVQNQLAMAVEKERMANEQLLEQGCKLATLEVQNTRYRQEKSQVTAQHEMIKAKVELLEEARSNEVAQIEAVRHSLTHEINELKREKLLMENQIEMERAKVETEKKKSILLQEQLREKEKERLRSRDTPSPATVSMHDSVTSISEPNTPLPIFTQEELLERSLMLVSHHSPNGNKMSLYETLRQTGAANLLDSLTSQLKQKEGEIIQLQSEIGELERTREAMARELVNLSTHNDTLHDQIEDLPRLKASYTDLEQRYNALLQMYGEKVEETEELKLDLQDVKELYKSQIDHLMKGH